MTPDPLDELLDLTDPAPNPTTARRLKAAYTTERTRTTHRRPFPILLTTTAAAAAILLLLLPTLFKVPKSNPTSAVLPIQPPPALRTGIDISPRSPTPTERLALLAAYPRPKQPVLSNPPKDPYLESLFSTLSSPIVANRLAAAETLGSIADYATVDRLIALTASPRTCREATVALLNSSSPKAKAFLSSQQAQPLLALIRSLEQQPKPPQSQTNPHLLPELL